MKKITDVNAFLESWFEANPLINKIVYGEPSAINNDKDYKPVTVNFWCDGFSGDDESVKEYTYIVFVVDKAAENLSDLEAVHSKTADICNALVAHINRSEDYKVEGSSAVRVTNAKNDKLQGWELTMSITTFNPESICP